MFIFLKNRWTKFRIGFYFYDAKLIKIRQIYSSFSEIDDNSFSAILK